MAAIISTIVSGVVTILAFALGVKFFFGDKHSAMYFRFITCAIGCYAFADTFWSTYFFLNKAIPTGFSITEISYFGAFLFLFTANKGQFDSLVDDGSPKFRKYRIFSLVAPIVLITMIIVYFIAGIRTEPVITMAIENFCFLPMVAASYYNMKHLIWPNSDYGFIKALKPVNLCLLLVYYFEACLLLCEVKSLVIPAIVFTYILAFLMLAIVFLAKRGREQWLI